jgi:hypothetical protein
MVAIDCKFQCSADPTITTMFLSSAAQKIRWVRWLIAFSLIPIFIFKFLFGTLIGVLLISWGLYAALPYLTGTEPWVAGQLLVWIDNLGNDAKIGLVTSLITVLGFFIAAQTSMRSWQKQTAATMRMTAGDSIDQVITEINSIILRIQIFTETLANEVGRVRVQGFTAQNASVLSALSEDVVTFRVNRQRFLQLQQELIALPSRYAMLLLPLIGTSPTLHAIAEQVRAVAEKVWVAAPVGGIEHPEHKRLLMESVDPVKYIELSKTCNSISTS